MTKMTKIINIFILFQLFLGFFIGCNSNSKKPNLKTVTLRQEWFPYSGYAGEMVAMYETDSIYGIDLKVEAGSDNIDPIKLVLSGKNDFGVASSDRVLIANEQGANLVVIGVINYLSPTCFLSQENLNIKTPKDFEDKKVGILTGTNTEYIYKALIIADSLDKSKLQEVEIPFDLATFIAGTYDIRPAFIYDEPVSLDLQNIKYNILKPSDFGVNFIGTVYFTRKDVVENQPELVESFIYAISDGWKIALNNPNKAIMYLKQYDKDIDENRELLSLNKGKDYFKGENGKLLFSTQERWDKMASDLMNLGVIKKYDYSNSINNNFVEKYNNK